MFTVKGRLILILGGSWLVAIALVFLGLQSYLSIEQGHEQISLGSQFLEIAKSAETQLKRKSKIEILKSLRPNLMPENREDAGSEIIVALQQKRWGELHTLLTYFEKLNQSYQQAFENNRPRHKSALTYYSLLGALFLFGGTVATLIYLFKSVMNPLMDTSRKMKDFLMGKYSYQFEVPPDNEVGNLQGSFNSLAQKVLSQMEELKALDKAKSDFLSIASHELRTPLTSIKGSLNLVCSGITEDLNETTLSLLNIAEIETNRLIRLINDILDFSKIEARMLTLECRWIDANQLVNFTVKALEGLATTAKVTLKTESDGPLYIFADPDRAQQILTNLISNAIKFTPENSTVTIGTDINIEQQALFYVQDQGEGIDPENQKYIFEKFRQVTSSESPIVKGTGLGLAIVKSLVEKHGGQVSVLSKPGQGSQFSFSMPQWQSAPPAELYSMTQEAA